MCQEHMDLWIFNEMLEKFLVGVLIKSFVIVNCIRESLPVLQVEISWKWEGTPPSSHSNTWTENNGQNYHHQLLSHLISSDLISVMSVRRSSSSSPPLEQCGGYENIKLPRHHFPLVLLVQLKVNFFLSNKFVTTATIVVLLYSNKLCDLHLPPPLAVIKFSGTTNTTDWSDLT